jgi:hypothetical protein
MRSSRSSTSAVPVRFPQVTLQSQCDLDAFDAAGGKTPAVVWAAGWLKDTTFHQAFDRLGLRGAVQ